MAREPTPEEPPDDVPAWFMTYSDVITLLMTFFILLLTFSTTDPERFDKFQVAAFGGAGSTGVAGDHPDGTEKDTWVMRTRPRAARLCLEGSEMPPMESDTSKKSLDKSLKSLDSDKFQNLVDKYVIELPIQQMVSAKGTLYDLGRHHARMLSVQMKKLPMDITLIVANDDALDRAIAFAQSLNVDFGIKPGKVGVQMAPESVKKGSMLVVVQHHMVQ